MDWRVMIHGRNNNGNGLLRVSRKPGILGRQHRITHKHLFQVAIFLFAIAAKATQAIPTHKHQMK